MQALGNHLSDILADEMADLSVIVEQVKDESRRKELRSNDDDEDYLDEGSASTYSTGWAEKARPQQERPHDFG